MHYYQFNLGDYSSHTQHLDLLEDLAYRRMIDWCYLHEIKLPKDVEEIARVIRMRTHCECIANVLREFFTKHSDGYSHPRIDEEIATYKAKSKKAKESANARWSKEANKTGGVADANALRTECERNANHKPITNNHKPVTKRDKSATALALKADRLPVDFKLPREWGEWALNNSPLSHEQIREEGEKFRDYWINVEGAKGRKKDWLATWRNWIRRAKDSGTLLGCPPPSQPNRKTFYQQDKEEKHLDSLERNKPLLEADKETLAKWGLL